MNRPETFDEWWKWGLEQADAAKHDKPYRLHQEDYPADALPDAAREKDVRGKPGRRLSRILGQIIGGPPYTSAFERYLDEEPPHSAMRSAMGRMYTRRGVQSHEYRILHALIEGHTDSEIVRAVVGGPVPSFFAPAVLRALAFVFDIAKWDLPAEVPLTPRTKGIASAQPNTRRGPASQERSKRRERDRQSVRVGTPDISTP